MIKNVFVPLDGSKLAETALAPARMIASRIGAQLVLLSAPWSTRSCLRRRSRPVWCAWRHMVAEDWGSRFSEELGEHGVRGEYEVVDGFDAADMLVQDAADRSAGFIAVASHGRTGVTRAPFGSVSTRTVRHAPCPVLVAGPACGDVWRDQESVGRTGSAG